MYLRLNMKRKLLYVSLGNVTGKLSASELQDKGISFVVKCSTTTRWGRI